MDRWGDGDGLDRGPKAPMTGVSKMGMSAFIKSSGGDAPPSCAGDVLLSSYPFPAIERSTPARHSCRAIRMHVQPHIQSTTAAIDAAPLSLHLFMTS